VLSPVTTFVVIFAVGLAAGTGLWFANHPCLEWRKVETVCPMLMTFGTQQGTWLYVPCMQDVCERRQ